MRPSPTDTAHKEECNNKQHGQLHCIELPMEPNRALQKEQIIESDQTPNHKAEKNDQVPIVNGKIKGKFIEIFFVSELVYDGTRGPF